MEKWRNPLGLATLCAGLMALTPSAANADNGWNDSNCCNFNSFEIGVDFLYWSPCVSDLDYVGVRTHHNVMESEGEDSKQSPTKFKIRSIDTDWEPGVRAFIKIPSCTCDWDVEASYTYIETRNTETRKVEEVNADMVPVNSHPNLQLRPIYHRAKGKWNAEYQEWDVLFVYNLHNTRCHKFSSFFGVAGIELDQKLNIELVPLEMYEAGSIKAAWKGDYWGVGFRAGSRYEYNVNDCVTFYTKVHGTVLAGEPKKVKSRYSREGMTAAAVDVAEAVEFCDDNRCQIVPGYNVAAGFAYNTDFCDTEWSLRLGYEFLHWFNLPRHRTFVGGKNQSLVDGDVALSTSSASTGRALGFHGLTAGVSVAF